MNLNKNIIFIGMPGAGKTTIGKKIASLLLVDFIDIDNCIEVEMGCTISSIFEKGEEYFRTIESKVIKNLHFVTPCIISTGGGIIKIPSNVDNLSKNGIVIFIDRDVSKILKSTNFSTRPLLKYHPNSLYDIYKDRYGSYVKYANLIVKNNGSIDNCVSEIMKIWRF